MSSEWAMLSLGELADVKHGWAFKSDFFSESPKENPIVVGIGNFKYEGGFRFESTKIKYYEGDFPSDYLLEAGDILLVMTCQTAGGEILGIPGKIPGDNKKYLHNQRLGKFINKRRDLLDDDYAYNLFKSADFNRFLASSASGTKILHTSPDRILQYSLELPPVSEQKAIAHILGTLDGKIELNRKTNETLEAMAKALFKSWFVDFDPVRAKAEGRPTGLPAEISDLFPDSFEDSELGEIPTGWNVRTVEEIAEKVAMGPFGSNIKVSTFVDRGIPVISGQHLKGAILHDGGNNFITPDHADKLKNSCVRRGDIVFTHAGSIGQVSLIPVNSEHQKYVLSQRQFYLRPSSNNLSHYLTMFFRSTNGQHVLLSNASQTGVPSIARPASFLRSIQMLIPRTELLDAFDRQISAMFTKARSITEQNQALLDIRDALLPKLISGEIRIPDAEKMLEEVGV